MAHFDLMEEDVEHRGLPTGFMDEFASEDEQAGSLFGEPIQQTEELHSIKRLFENTREVEIL